MGERSIYEAAGGLPALTALAHAWHERCLADDVLAHAFSHGYHPDHSARLAAYWAEALGGPPTYSTSMAGETEVMRMHSGNGEHAEMDRRAVAAFADAVEACTAAGDLPSDPRVGEALVAYFTWGVSYFAQYHRSADDVPDGLELPHWGWRGLLQ